MHHCMELSGEGDDWLTTHRCPQATWKAGGLKENQGKKNTIDVHSKGKLNHT